MTTTDAATAAEPQACTFGPLATPRKRVLFACECAGGFGGSLADPRVRAAVRTGRDYAAGRVPVVELEAAVRGVDAAVADAQAICSRPVWTIPEATRAARAREEWRSARIVADALGWALRPGARAWPAADLPGTTRVERALVRGLADRTHHVPEVDPAWVTSTVAALAHTVRADGAFGLLPILADALMDAGCTDEAVLDHCRGDGPHGPDCWVLDLLAG
jgi:hypothetical protein